MTHAPKFPTALRKMWSGGEVQEWVSKNMPPVVPPVPAQVWAALERMGTPLHDSRLSGATADLDAQNIATIRAHIVAVDKIAAGITPDPSAAWLDAARVSDIPEVHEALEGFAEDPTGTTGTIVVQAVMEACRSRAAYPSANPVGRMGDMAPPGKSHMTVMLDGDSDACVEIWDHETGIHGSRASIEFCTNFGGGSSPRTRQALVNLMLAMQADNEADPRKQWPPERP